MTVTKYDSNFVIVDVHSSNLDLKVKPVNLFSWDIKGYFYYIHQGLLNKCTEVHI